MVVSNRNLLFQESIFRCYVSFRDGTPFLVFFWQLPMPLRGWSINHGWVWKGSQMWTCDFNVLQLPINIFWWVEKFREAQLLFCFKRCCLLGIIWGRSVGSSIFVWGVLRLEDHAIWCVVFPLKPLNKTPWSGVFCIALPWPWNAPQ